MAKSKDVYVVVTEATIRAVEEAETDRCQGR